VHFSSFLFAHSLLDASFSFFVTFLVLEIEHRAFEVSALPLNYTPSLVSLKLIYISSSYITKSAVFIIHVNFYYSIVYTGLCTIDLCSHVEHTHVTSIQIKKQHHWH
jgi:hypothetical protein